EIRYADPECRSSALRWIAFDGVPPSSSSQPGVEVVHDLIDVRQGRHSLRTRVGGGYVDWPGEALIDVQWPSHQGRIDREDLAIGDMADDTRLRALPTGDRNRDVEVHDFARVRIAEELGGRPHHGTSGRRFERADRCGESASTEEKPFTSAQAFRYGQIPA